MGDHYRGLVPHQFVHRAGHFRLAHDVEIARRLVEQKVVGVSQHGARNGDALPLTAGEIGAAKPHVLVKAAGLRGDAVVAVGSAGGLRQLLVADLAVKTVGDILAHGAADERIAL